MLRAVVNNIKWPKTLIVFFWHFVLIFLEFFNYATYMRFERNVLWTADVVDAQLAFVIITTFAFLFVGGPLLVMSYKYSSTERQRTFRLKAAITVMFLTSTTPLFFIELFQVKDEGIVGILQGTCFILQFIAWLFSAWIVWFFYMMEVARFIHERRGYGRDVLFKKARMAQTMSGMPDMWKNNTVPVTNPTQNQPWVV